jgi:hypothetical protein
MMSSTSEQYDAKKFPLCAPTGTGNVDHRGRRPSCPMSSSRGAKGATTSETSSIDTYQSKPSDAPDREHRV